MKTKKTVLYILIALILLGAGAFTIYKNQQEIKRQTAIIARENAEVPVKVATVKKEKLSARYEANGTLAPYQQMQLSAEMPGKITKIFVKEGDFVRQGQVLATIKKENLKVSYATAKASYQNALTNNQRFEKAYQSGGVTKQQLDQSRLRLKNAKNQMKQAKIRVGDANIKTLISGYINQKMVEPGMVVGAGTPLFQIVNLSSLKLKVTVNEGEVARLKIGDTVKVKVGVLPDKVFSGKITFIAPMANASLSYPVEVTLQNDAGHQLRAGMYARAIFGTGKNASGGKHLVIPKGAFVNGISSQQVFVVKKDSTVSLTKVVSGRVLGDQVEILKGLQPNAKVVASGQINLREGVKVRITH